MRTLGFDKPLYILPFDHIELFHPTFCKVLVRYNPEGDAALNHLTKAVVRISRRP